MGEIKLQEGQFGTAIERFKLAQKIDPRIMGIHLGWGRALLAQNHADDAVTEFRTVLNADPKNYEAHRYLGDAYVLIGRNGPAAEEFHASLAAQANQPEVLNNLAWIRATDPRAELRNGTNAVILAARACELTRGSQPAFLGTLAAAYAEIGNFDEAVKWAQKAHDVAAADAEAAQKSNDLSAAHALQTLATLDLESLALYKSHQPYRAQPGK
jgi:Flp pilus assembly protein TadD